LKLGVKIHLRVHGITGNHDRFVSIDLRAESSAINVWENRPSKHGQKCIVLKGEYHEKM